MTAAALDEDQRADLPRALKGNLCRCTGYRAIADAIGRGAATARNRTARRGRRSLPGRPPGARIVSPGARRTPSTWRRAQACCT